MENNTHHQADSIAYFGYGSLVNLTTLRTPYLTAHRARVEGWERVWLARPKIQGGYSPVDGLAFLSVRAARGSSIDGLVITDHRDSLAALDAREALYSRTPLARDTIRYHDDAPQIEDSFLYVADAAPATGEAHILRSYLDAVMQGYLVRFGEQGVRDFLASTANFDLPIREDREQPLYPRAVALTAEEAAFFDGLTGKG